MSTTVEPQQTRGTQTRVFVSLAIFAVVAWGAILATPGALFWDDWVVVNDDTLGVYSDVGLPWVGPVYVALFALGPWTFKVVAIVATIIVGCATYAISGRGLGLGHRERWLLSALVVVLPLCSTREIAILNLYSWSTALFFVAWYLLVRSSPSAPGRLRYVVGAVLLFASYTTGSLLPFTALPAAHLAYLALSDGTPFRRGAVAFLRRFWWLALAPVVFWVVKTIYFQPSGLYEDYNQIRLHADPIGLAAIALTLGFGVVGLLLIYLLAAGYHHREPRARLLVRAALAGGTGVVALFLYATQISRTPTGLLIAVGLGACAVVLGIGLVVDVVRRIRGAEAATLATNVEALLAVGLLALALAMIPYLVVGKLPSFQSWETRHQLLMPLGFAVIVVATLRSALSWMASKAAWILALGFLLAATLGSISVSLALVADWNKQMQVSGALAADSQVRDAQTVVFSDQCAGLNFDSRPHAFYEYTGWLWTAFGDRTRLGIDEPEVPAFLDGGYEGALDHAVRYGIDDYVVSDDGVLVEIVSIPGTSWWDLLANRPSVTIRVTPIDDLSVLR